MKKWLLLLMLVSPTVARAELVTPQFTQGSMNATTTTNQVITEDIHQKIYGSEMTKWSGENVKIDTTSEGIAGGIGVTGQIFEIETIGDPFTLEIITRAEGTLVEELTNLKTITTDSTTTSLSVFSQ